MASPIFIASFALTDTESPCWLRERFHESFMKLEQERAGALSPSLFSAHAAVDNSGSGKIVTLICNRCPSFSKH
jgi:hypothetical protein